MKLRKWDCKAQAYKWSDEWVEYYLLNTKLGLFLSAIVIVACMWLGAVVLFSFA